MPADSHASDEARKHDAPLSINRTVLLQLYGLSALFIAQPVLSRLSANLPYLEADSIGPGAVVVAAALLLVLPPVVLYFSLRGISAVSRVAGRAALLATLSLLLFAGCQLSLKWLSRNLNLMLYGVPELALTVIAVIAGLVLARQILMRRGLRSVLTVIGLGALMIPITFPFSGQMPQFLFPAAEPAPKADSSFQNPVPIVMIVFDGLNGMALLNEQHEIDRARYPGFARLADMSTWYRNASTVHNRTDNAVPAILTGRMPPGDLLPLASEYPDNLFQLIHDSRQYEMTVFEPYTRLCPRELKPHPAVQPLWTQLRSLMGTLALVYVDTTAPDDVAVLNALIPRTWFGLPRSMTFDQSERSGLLTYAWDIERIDQVNHFQKCLARSDQPTFHFLHLVAPHYPWRYTPTRRIYLDSADAGDYPPGTHGIVGEDWGPDELAVQQAWQRYLMQLGFVDRSLAELLDELERQQMLDECLLVVVADHGVAFRAGTTRRDPTAATLPDIMPIPLFIKLPHQRTGSVTDRNVENIDVLPTILDVLNPAAPPPTDGQSLLDESLPPRLRKTLISLGETFVIEPDFPERFDYVRRMVGLFGTGGENDRLFELHTDPLLVGRPLSELRTDEAGGMRIRLFPGVDLRRSATESYVPCLVRGTVQSADSELPVELAIVVNGRIETTTRTLQDPGFAFEWTAMVDESVFQPGQNAIQICRIHRRDGEVVLSPCEIVP